jgi:hypothetical protein
VTPEEELEGVLWAVLTLFKVDVEQPGLLIDVIKAAAIRYAMGDSEALTAARRSVLAEAAGDPGTLRLLAGLASLSTRGVDNGR